MPRKKARKSSSTALAPRRTARVARHARRAGRAALSTADLWGPLIAAGGLGFLEREGISIPHFGAIGEAGTIAVVGFAALKAGVVPAGMRKLVQNAVLAAGALAVYEMAKSGSLPGGKKVTGDDGPYIAHDVHGQDE